MTQIGWRGRFFRWLSDTFRPGVREEDSAKASFKAYLVSQDLKRLNATIDDYQVAIDKYRKHRKPALVTAMINCGVAVRKRYDVGQSLEDLEKIIDLGTNALEFWSGSKEKNSYVLLLSTLADAYFEQSQRAIHPAHRDQILKKEQDAFNHAAKLYTELKDNGAAGIRHNTALAQLGVMSRIRCERRRTLDGFEVGVGQLKEAFIELTTIVDDLESSGADNAGKQTKALANNTKATCLFNLAESYDLRYGLLNDPQNIEDLNTAIEYSTLAKHLLEDLQRPELPACLFNLGRQLQLRWRQTNHNSDHIMAVESAQAARELAGGDELLQANITQLLGVLNPLESAGDG